MNIYVGNLHYDIGEDDLKEVFAEYGEVVSVKIIMDKMSGKSKGFGFVEFSEKQDALKAIEELNGAELKGRNLKVNLAREKSNSGGGGYNKRQPRHNSYNR